MTEQRVMILTVLGQGPMSIRSLADQAMCEVEELENFIIPPLKIMLPNHPALVRVGSRGHYITRAGLAELDKRGIAHRGDAAIPKNGAA